MIDFKMLPLNIALLILNAEDTRGMRQTKVLDIFDGMSKNFHPDGLFSVEAYGKVGDERRNRLFSYIDLHVPVFHPLIFKNLLDLKSLYGEIMSGRAYAYFDEKTSDFVKSDAVDGKTGFDFFFQHFQKIKFEQRDSTRRTHLIKLVEKNKKNCAIERLVVMPAGLRDYTIDDNGKPSEDEINALYRKVLSVSAAVQGVNIKVNPEYIDAARFQLQLAVLEIYNYIVSLLEGKHKLVLGKWAARKVVNSTRNVITSYVPDEKVLHGPRAVRANETVIGLHQYARMILPLAVKHIRDGYLSNVFTGPNTPAMMTDKKTLKKVPVQIDPSYYDEWMTYEGIEKTLARFGEEELRHEALEAGSYYFGLVYNDGKRFKIFQDIDELPDGFDKKFVKPLTFAELVYTSLYKDSREIPCFITRYPITGYGSIFPSYVYLKTTAKSAQVIEMNDAWEDTDTVAFEYPLVGESFYNSMSPHPSHLARLGADFDGDMCSATAVLTKEAQDEVRALLNSAKYYISADGRMSFSASDDIVDLVLSCITG